MISLNNQIRKQFETVLQNVPKSKISLLSDLLQTNKLDASSSVYDFQNELGISSSQVNVLRNALKLMPDSFSASIVLDLLDELRQTKQTHTDSTQLVMTNPLVDDKTSYTLGKMLEMISEAESHIMLIGYAVYGDIKSILDAMAKVKDEKGVVIDFLFNNARKFQKEIKENWNVKVPLPNIYTYRSKQGRSSLHAKVLIIDDKSVLVTSANMTENAMEKNVEMGIVHYGSIVKDAKMLFQALIDQGYLVKLT